MSTGGGTGFNPRHVHSQEKSDKSLMGKLKDAVKPSKHTSSEPSSKSPHTGEGEAYSSRHQEGIQPPQHPGVMPGGMGMRDQSPDIGELPDMYKPEMGVREHSPSGTEGKATTNNMYTAR